MRSLLSVLKNIMQKLSLKTEIKLLWTNANPTSAFGEQTIELPQAPSDFDYTTIWYLPHKADKYSESVDCPAGGGAMLQFIGSVGAGNSYMTGWVRYVDVNANNITFTNCAYKTVNSQSPARNNDGCIPIRIYGIKIRGGGTA